MKFSRSLPLLSIILVLSSSTAFAGYRADALFVDFVHGDDPSAMRGTTHAYKTLQEAIAHAQPHDTIEIYPTIVSLDLSNYNTGTASAESIEINQPLNIRGYGVTIKGYSTLGRSRIRVNTAGSGTTIEGLSFDLTTTSDRPETTTFQVGAIDVLNASDVTLRDINVSHSKDWSLSVRGNSPNCTIDNLHADDVASGILGLDGPYDNFRILHPAITHLNSADPATRGIKLNGRATNLLIEHPVISGSAGMGIELAADNQRRFLVDGGDISGTQVGVSVDHVHQGVVRGVRCMANTAYALEIAQDCSDVTLESCYVDGHDPVSGASALVTGVTTSASNNANLSGIVIRGCTFLGTTNAALHPQSSDGIIIEDCTIRYDTGGGINVQNCDRPIVRRNYFEVQSPYISEWLGFDASIPAVRNILVEDNTVMTPHLGLSSAGVTLYGPDSSHQFVYPTFRRNRVIRSDSAPGVQSFIGGGYIQTQNATVIGIILQDNLPLEYAGGAGQTGWINNYSVSAESIAGNTLTLSTSGYGGRLTGDIQSGVGGITQLQVVEGGTITNALTVRNDNLGKRVHTDVPLAIDSGVSGLLPLVGPTSSPNTPASGVVFLWVANDGKLHAKGSDGIDRPLW